MSVATAGPCDRGVAAAAPESAAAATHPTCTLAATILGSSLAFIDGSVVNVGLPAIERDLASSGASGATIGWLINAYLLPLGALVLLGVRREQRDGACRGLAGDSVARGRARRRCGRSGIRAAFQSSRIGRCRARGAIGVGGLCTRPGQRPDTHQPQTSPLTASGPRPPSALFARAYLSRAGMRRPHLVGCQAGELDEPGGLI